MAALVERLRDAHSYRESGRGLDAQTTQVWHNICLEAADEIERLNARLSPSSYIDGLGSEIDSLHEALAEQRRKFGLEIDDLHAELQRVRRVAAEEIDRQREDAEDRLCAAVVAERERCARAICKNCDGRFFLLEWDAAENEWVHVNSNGPGIACASSCAASAFLPAPTPEPADASD